MLANAVRFALLGVICYTAYQIRLHALREFGLVIHEFDPWFNYRATEYLAEHGLSNFFKWYDYKVWYPLGRPVGTTIYPGMQMTSVAIWNILNFFGIEMSLNDVCCYVPAWFGVTATLALGLLARETSGSNNAGVAAAAIMSVVPAHIMRSVGGGYDNESIAMTAMCTTFFLWVRSLRDQKSWKWGAAAGIAYIYMVAAWGGYVFVINLIGVHAAILVLIGRYSPNLHRAYSLFYIIGTIGAIQIPVVGWTPLKSLEQMGPLLVFLSLQLWEFCESIRRKNNPSADLVYMLQLRVKVFSIAVIGASFLAFCLMQIGYFGPLSSRVRGLFVRHTRTGNPLVDSVSEHQPADASAYWTYLYYIYYLAPIGMILSFFDRTDSKYFIVIYGFIAYYFSSKMNRLVILLGPVASCLGGCALAFLFEWSFDQYKFLIEKDEPEEEPEPEPVQEETTKKGKKGKKHPNLSSALNKQKQKKKGNKYFRPLIEMYQVMIIPRRIAAILVVYGILFYSRDFNAYCHKAAVRFSHPQLMFKAQLNDGTEIMLDDYREAYWFLRDQTPEDSRVMAWWDYGYQITGIGNRTTIADGNTWNHEHIATLGYCLTSPEKRAYKLIRHLADYVLVWSGGGSDDLAKSPHLARIANSVYDDVCPGDPKCHAYGFTDRQGTPTPMMARSLLYKLTQHNFKPGVQLNPKYFREVYTSKYRKVRIYEVVKPSKKSKAWVADPANLKCDAPGSWYCEGQYPPALDKLINRRKDFSQLEDFNRKKDAATMKKAEQYQKKYHQSF